MFKKTSITLALLPFVGVSAIAATTQPNIIMFLVDDMGWQDTSVSFYQDASGNFVAGTLNGRYKTPNMERLAAKGVKFTRAYACPVSSPSRISLMTGANAARHGVTNWTNNTASNSNTDNTGRLGGLTPSDWNINGMNPATGTPQITGAGTLTTRTFTATPLAQLLRQNGYRTIHVGKAHLGTPNTAASNPLNLGFDVNIAGSAIGGPATYFATNQQEDGGYLYGSGGGNTVYGLTEWNKNGEYLNEALTKAAIDKISEAKGMNKPFFLYMSHYAVHAPYGAGTSLDSRFTDPNSEYYIEDYAKLSGQQQVYATMISSMDKSLGDILNKIENDPLLASNTVIMFMADNGGHLSNGNSPAQQGKGSCWEGGIHEPMMVYTPETATGGTKASLAGTANASPVIIEDFFPTILEMAGVTNPTTVQTIDGTSFLPALNEGTTQNTTRGLVFHYPNGWGEFTSSTQTGDPASAIVKGDYKYIYLYKSQSHYLYNLKNDIGETTNLATTEPTKLAEMQTELTNLLKERNAPMLYTTSAKTQYVPYPDGSGSVVPEEPTYVATERTQHLDFNNLQIARDPSVAAGAAGTALSTTTVEAKKMTLSTGTEINASVSYSGTIKPTGTGGQFTDNSELVGTVAVTEFLREAPTNSSRAIWGDSITLEAANAGVNVALSGFKPSTKYRVRVLSGRKNNWYSASGTATFDFSGTGLTVDKIGFRGCTAGSNETAATEALISSSGTKFSAIHSTSSGSNTNGYSLCFVWEFTTPATWTGTSEATLAITGPCALSGVSVEESPADNSEIPNVSYPGSSESLITEPTDFVASDATISTDNAVWHNEPGTWYENLYANGNNENRWAADTTPIGNGRIGGLIYGGCGTDRLELNEISFWSGGNCSVDNKSSNGGQGANVPATLFGSYQPFAFLTVEQYRSGTATDYRRVLDLEDGIAKVRYTVDGVDFEKEYYTSQPHQVVVMNCTANTAGTLNAKFALTLRHSAQETVEIIDGDTIKLRGTLVNGVVYEGRWKVRHVGGTLSAEGSALKLVGATSYNVVMAMATDYKLDSASNWKNPVDPGTTVATQISAVGALNSSELRSAHVNNYKSLFDRVKLDLGESTSAARNKPFPQRLADYKTACSSTSIGRAATGTNDPELEAMLFNFGRYLIISSSQPGALPMNLQGLWNYATNPPWDSDYHTNINVEMCYWAQEIVNLSESNQPLMDYIEAIIPAAKIHTQAKYKNQAGGTVRGWTARTAMNPFGGQGYEWNTPASAWYMLHIWERYRFTMDETFLREKAYPMMKEVCNFWEDQLKTLTKNQDGTWSNFTSEFRDATPEKIATDLADIADGALVAPLGWSPEQTVDNKAREDGIAHDQQLIWELFDDTIKAAEILGTDTGADAEWIAALRVKRDKLVGPKISPNGYLQEWMLDRLGDAGHRHTSHLFAVYPGRQINATETPEFFAAAKQSLILRGNTGDSQRSWAWGWRSNLWARFAEGDNAYAMIQGAFRANTLNSMFTTHTPMQIDGNMGLTAGIAEMLLQSHVEGKIQLLPALPTVTWKKGSVKGLKARGNIFVDMAWENGSVTKYRLASTSQTPVDVVVNGETKTLTPFLYHDPAIPLLTLSKNSWNPNSKAQYLDVTVESNEPWTLSVPASISSWLSVDKTSGDSGEVVRITISANAGTVLRSGEISFATSALTQVLSISQEIAPSYDSWADQKDFATEADKALDATPAKDGIINLEKFVFDATGTLDPKTPAGAFGRPEIFTTGAGTVDEKDYLILRFPYNSAAAGVTLSAECLENPDAETPTWTSASNKISLRKTESEIVITLLDPITTAMSKQVVRLTGTLDGKTFTTEPYGYELISVPAKATTKFGLRVHKPFIFQKEISAGTNPLPFDVGIGDHADEVTINDYDLPAKIDSAKSYIVEILTEAVAGARVSTPFIVNRNAWRGLTDMTKDTGTVTFVCANLADYLPANAATIVGYRIREASTLSDVFGSAAESGLKTGTSRTADMVKFHILDKNLWSFWVNSRNVFDAGSLNGVGVNPAATPIFYHRPIQLQRRENNVLSFILTGEVLTDSQEIHVYKGDGNVSPGLLFDDGGTISTPTEEGDIQIDSKL